MGSGHIEDASAHANGALALSRRIDHAPCLIHCPTMLGHWQIKTDDHQGALESSEELETIAQSHHLGAVGINAQVLRGWAGAHRGALERGLDELDAGVEKWRRTGAGLHLAQCISVLGEVYAMAGRHGAAAQAFDNAIAMSRESKHMQ